MRKLFKIVAVLTAFTQFGLPALEACGAKFLVATRAARYQRLQRSDRPANILAYQRSNDNGTAEFMAKLRKLVEPVGHKFTLVTSENALRDAARTHNFDMVMTNLETARQLKGDIESWAPDMKILPMAPLVTTSEATLARGEFGQVLTLPAKESEVLATIQDTRDRK